MSKNFATSATRTDSQCVTVADMVTKVADFLHFNTKSIVF